LFLRLIGLAAFVLLTWWIARPFLRHLAAKTVQTGELSSLGVLLALLFLSGLVTQQIGIHAIFGGFWLGVLLHTEAEFVQWWRERVAGFVTVFFLPIFFTFTGLRTNVPGLGSWENAAWCAALVLLAMLGKFGGCWLAGRRAGLVDREARCVAIMMNTRGMLELVVANVGFELHLIPQPVFTMLVVLALLSTVLTAPCLRAWLPEELRLHPSL
jgi:Kef-type K+ transport system membrane component KefB